MKHLTLSAVFFLCCCALLQAEETTDPPSPGADEEDANLTVPELITKYGYPVEEHQVQTPDGYVLTLHRIPHGRKSHTISVSEVVFLMHGLLCSSADWIITGADKSLAYLLADEGYDVWMGNARGNTYSRNHTTLNPDEDSDFWEFSWHEIGTTDVPTMIDYVLETTGRKQLYHVGHSQGTTSFYVMASTRPEYNDKIKAHFSLAPIAFMSHMTSPLLQVLSTFSGTAEALIELIGAAEFMPSTDFLAMVGDKLCDDDDPTQVLCTNSLFAVCGFNRKQMNASLLPVLMGHTPAGASVKQVLHYMQEIASGGFRQYDFGLLDNVRKYGQFSPPDYDLEAIKAPVYLLYSRNDWLAAEVDVKQLCDGMGSSCVEKILVSDEDFNHLDYLYGIGAPEVVYKKVINLMEKL